MSQVTIDGHTYEQGPDGHWTEVSPKPSVGLGSIAQPIINEGIHQGINSLIGPSGTAPGVPNVISINGAPPVEAAAPSAWTAAPANGSLGQIGGALAVLHGGYGAFNDWQSGHSGRGSLTEAGAGVGSIFGGPVGGAIGAGFGNIMGYGLQGDGWKNHIALAATMPPLEVARLMGFDLVHKTTKQFEQERWKETLDQSKDPAWQQRVGGLASLAHPQGDTGQGWTPEVAAAAIKDPTQSWGSQGMLNTFGPDYFNKMNEYQRYAATKYAIDHNLLANDHGDITVTDPEILKNALKDFTGNKDYLKAYNLWKKANPKELGIPGVGKTPASSAPAADGKIPLSIVMPNSQGNDKAQRMMQVQNVLQNSQMQPYQKLKIGSSLRGLMPANFGSY